MGEIGLPIFKLLSKNMPVDGLDKIEKLNSEKFIDIKKRMKQKIKDKNK